MFRRKGLSWVQQPVGELEARNDKYRFVIWNYGEKEGTELRFYRYDTIGFGVGVPFYDFSIRVRDERAAKVLADKLNREFVKARRYNNFSL